METIGQLLKSIRLQKNIKLEEVSKQTNIATHLLDFLEQDNYANLPSSTFTKGFIVSYARVLGFSPEKALAIFRRDFTITESGKILPKGLAKPLDRPTIVTSKFLSISFTSIFIMIFLTYLFTQLKNFNSAPRIDIVRPKSNTVVRGPEISVKGFVSADSSVYVNGSIVDVFPTGEFFTNTTLASGDQVITIKAINNKNKESQTEIPVIVVDK